MLSPRCGLSFEAEKCGLGLMGVMASAGASQDNKLGGGLSPGHGERGSASLYRGLGAEPPAGVQETEPPEGVLLIIKLHY